MPEPPLAPPLDPPLASRLPTGWRRLKASLLLQRDPWMRVYADDVLLPDGRQVEGFLRVEGRPYATIFALTDAGQVPFLRQYKYGLDRVALQTPGRVSRSR